MKAVVIAEHGGLDKLVYRDWPDPVAGPDDLVVRVAACGLNHLDRLRPARHAGRRA